MRCSNEKLRANSPKRRSVTQYVASSTASFFSEAGAAAVGVATGTAIVPSVDAAEAALLAGGVSVAAESGVSASSYSSSTVAEW